MWSRRMARSARPTSSPESRRRRRKQAELRALPHPGLHRFFQGATWLWAGIFLLLTLGLVVLMFTEPRRFPDALDRRHHRACRRRNRRFHAVVPLGAAQAWAEAPFCLSLSPAAATGDHRIRAPPPPARPPAGGPQSRNGESASQTPAGASAPADDSLEGVTQP